MRPTVRRSRRRCCTRPAVRLPRRLRSARRRLRPDTGTASPGPVRARSSAPSPVGSAGSGPGAPSAMIAARCRVSRSAYSVWRLPASARISAVKASPSSPEISLSRALTSDKRTRILCNAVIVVTPGGFRRYALNPEVTSRPGPPTMLDYMGWTLSEPVAEGIPAPPMLGDCGPMAPSDRPGKASQDFPGHRSRHAGAGPYDAPPAVQRARSGGNASRPGPEPPGAPVANCGDYAPGSTVQS